MNPHDNPPVSNTSFITKETERQILVSLRSHHWFGILPGILIQICLASSLAFCDAFLQATLSVTDGSRPVICTALGDTVYTVLYRASSPWRTWI